MKSIRVQRFLFGILKVRLLTCSLINDLFVIKIMYRKCFPFTVTLKLDILENLFFVLFLQISQHSMILFIVLLLLLLVWEKGVEAKHIQRKSHNLLHIIIKNGRTNKLHVFSCNIVSSMIVIPQVNLVYILP